MALQPWRKGKVIRIVDHTPTTKRFWIEVPDAPAFDFIPGQFVTLDLPIHEKPNKRWRSYSIASWPDGTNVFELVIVLDQKGAGTPYLFNEVVVGSELTLRGPQGVFIFKEPFTKCCVKKEYSFSVSCPEKEDVVGNPLGAIFILCVNASPNPQALKLIVKSP